MTVKLLIKHHLEYLSLKGGCTDSSVSTLVKKPHCWKSHGMAQLCIYNLDDKSDVQNFSKENLKRKYKLEQKRICLCSTPKRPKLAFSYYRPEAFN